MAEATERRVVLIKGDTTKYVLLHHYEDKGVVKLCELGADPKTEWFKQLETNVEDILDDRVPARYLATGGRGGGGGGASEGSQLTEVVGVRGWVGVAELAKMYVPGGKPDLITGEIKTRPVFLRRIYMRHAGYGCELQFTVTKRRPSWDQAQQDDCEKEAREGMGRRAWDELTRPERVAYAKEVWRAVAPDPVVRVMDKRDDKSMSRAAFVAMALRWFREAPNVTLMVLPEDRVERAAFLKEERRKADKVGLAKLDELFNALWV